MLNLLALVLLPPLALLPPPKVWNPPMLKLLPLLPTGMLFIADVRLLLLGLPWGLRLNEVASAAHWAFWLGLLMSVPTTLNLRREKANRKKSQDEERSDE